MLSVLGLQAEHAARRELLQERADELRRSRARVVEAQDDERRRLERDIHDGAQQHLVALAVNLRLAQTVAARDADRAPGLLAGQADAARDAMRTLADLARGIYPAQLTTAGLVPALRDALRGSPCPVDVETAPGDGDVAPPPEVAAALYFVVLEAVQNAGKHARAGAPSSGCRWRPTRSRSSSRTTVSASTCGASATTGPGWPTCTTGWTRSAADSS